jgi:hypothetical protein
MFLGKELPLWRFASIFERIMIVFIFSCFILAKNTVPFEWFTGISFLVTDPDRLVMITTPAGLILSYHHRLTKIPASTTQM